MYKKTKPAYDAYTFSLGGIKTISSFVAAPAVASDRINKVRDDRINRIRKGNSNEISGDQQLESGCWPGRHREAA